MGAAGADPAMIEDENEIGVAHCAKALGDDKGRTSFHQVAERQLNFMFRGGVNTGRGIVQDQNARIFEQRARNRDALFLATGKGDAAFAHIGFITSRHGHNEIMGLGRLGGCDHFCFVGAGAPKD